MKISGKTLFTKVRELHPELSSVITPQILDKVCDEPSVQLFLQWFCENVKTDNVLTQEEVQMLHKIEAEKEWLEGAELDLALECATKDCPALLKIASFDDIDTNDLYAELEILKDSCKEDENYVHILQTGIQNLKKLEIKLDEDIEQQEESLHKEIIEADRAYKECSILLRDFDMYNHEFFKEVEELLNIYADAAENRGSPFLWTQMPLELFVKKIELYNHYLDVYIKRQFGHTHKEEQNTDSNYVSLMNNSNEKRMDNVKLQELTLCKTNLINAKIDNVMAKAKEESYVAVYNYVQEIYNFGSLKIPRHSEIRTEISELTRKRDFLEENVSLLQDRQLMEVVQQFSELEITKVLKQDAQARLERAKNHLEKLKNLLSLAREHGHVRTDLLCMLMEMQSHHLKDVSEFIVDARHYLTTEYTLSAARCETMQQQQNEYSATVSYSSKIHNSFHKLFSSMVCGADNMQPFNITLDKYKAIIDDNKYKMQYIFETYLKSKIDKLKSLENEVNSQYKTELDKGVTRTFKPVPYNIETCYNEAIDSLLKVQTDLTKIRNQIKERLKTDATLERERNILWQRFLVDPDTLKKTYQELKQAAHKSCFGDSNPNERDA